MRSALYLRPRLKLYFNPSKKYKTLHPLRQRQRRDARCTATDVYRLRTDSVVWANSPQIQVLDRSNTTRIQVLAKLG